MSGKTSCNEDEDDLMSTNWPHSQRSNSCVSHSDEKLATCNGSKGVRAASETPRSLDNVSRDGLSHEATPTDRRLRRQIANCNERRRMQSINAGFQALRHLLPRKDGEKLSKAAILQQTAEFIHRLMAEKNNPSEDSNPILAKKRRLAECEQSEITELRESPVLVGRHSLNEQQADVSTYLRTIDELKGALSKEQQLRMIYEHELIEIKRYTSSLGFGPNLPIVHQLSPRLERGDINATSNLLGAQPNLNSLAAQNAAANAYLLNAAASLAQSQPVLTPSQSSTYHQLQPVPVRMHSTESSLATSAGDPPSKTSFPLNAAIGGTSSRSVFSVAPTAATVSNGELTASIAQRNLQAIIDAIRHIEGGVMAARSSSSPHPTDVMVR
jgi:hypothetical protein